MKTLVIYGSRRGTTKYCAELIEKILGKDSTIVDASSRDIRLSIDNYERIIIGANAFNYKLNKTVRSFIKKNLSIILKKKVYLFICSGAKKETDKISLYKASYPEELLKKAESMENFGGRLDTSKESWLIKSILKRMNIDDYNTIDENTVIQWVNNLVNNITEVTNG